jgi:hypothetical protein
MTCFADERNAAIALYSQPEGINYMIPVGRTYKANPKIPPASGFGLFFWRENFKSKLLILTPKK